MRVTIKKPGFTQEEVVYETFTDVSKEDKSYVKEVSHTKRKTGFRFFIEFLTEAFLPQGYPDSVSPDYCQYQIWDSLQAFCSTLSGMLAIKAVLEGIGVGEENASPLAAAMTWFIKDGIGKVAGILFTYIKGTKLDVNSKKWRLFADVLNDLALALELGLPYIPKYGIIYFLSASCAMKAIVGVAGSATRAALTTHHAIRGNKADVTAKDGSQETVVNLLATVLGLGFLGTDFVQSYNWLIMFTLASLHLYCNYRAVKSIELSKFNEERFLIAFDDYIRQGSLPSVASVNRKESVIFGYGISAKEICGFHLIVGDCLSSSSIFRGMDLKNLGKYFLALRNKDTISVILHSSCESSDITKGFFHGLILGCLLSGKTGIFSDEPKLLSNRLRELNRHKNLVQVSYSLVEEQWSEFKSDCKLKNWSLTETSLFDRGFRADWKLERKML